MDDKRRGTDQEGVYLLRIQNDLRRFKIGYSTNIRRRLRSLEVVMPFSLEIIGQIKGGQKEEAKLKRYCSAYRIKGEWFILPEEYHHDLDLLTRDLTAVLNNEQPYFVFPKMLPERYGYVNYLTDVQRVTILHPEKPLVFNSIQNEDVIYMRVRGIIIQFPTEFHISTIAEKINISRNDGLTPLRKVCNEMVRRGFLERVAHGIYRKKQPRIYIVRGMNAS